MGACVYCLRRGHFHACRCEPEQCRACGLYVTHCWCLGLTLRPVWERLAAADPEGGLDVPDVSRPPPRPGATVGG
ncbi:MAG: hypothetical protein U0871_01240 [Gemmataceae bacterium]